MSDTPRKVAIICSHGGLDEAYPALILANAARQSDIEAFVFFTFWGLDVITGRNLVGLADVAERRGDRGLALQHLEAAGALFERHGAKLYLDQVRAKQAELGA